MVGALVQETDKGQFCPRPDFQQSDSTVLQVLLLRLCPRTVLTNSGGR